jgi:hypothetical protein
MYMKVYGIQSTDYEIAEDSAYANTVKYIVEATNRSLEILTTPG